MSNELSEAARIATEAKKERLREEFEGKSWLIGYTDYDEVKDKGSNVLCFELCPEYIDYLKGLLKPYS